MMLLALTSELYIAPDKIVKVKFGQTDPATGAPVVRFAEIRTVDGSVTTLVGDEELGPLETWMERETARW